jgi:glycerol uptake operon antiterminator
MASIESLLRQNPIIAACTPQRLDSAMSSPVLSILLLYASILDFSSDEFVRKLKQKQVFLHADLLKGLSVDRDAIGYLVSKVPGIGIVSTKSSVIKIALKLGIPCIQRVFLIDTKSLESSIESIRTNPPNAVELMPALASSIVPELKRHLTMPIIMAGLLQNEAQIRRALKDGADGVSLSKEELWSLA